MRCRGFSELPQPRLVSSNSQAGAASFSAAPTRLQLFVLSVLRASIETSSLCLDGVLNARLRTERCGLWFGPHDNIIDDVVDTLDSLCEALGSSLEIRISRMTTEHGGSARDLYINLS